MTWVRPADWLTLPTLGPTDQRMVGLFAVGDHDSNFCALTVTGTGSYVVDWGDGTTPSTVASGSTAYHNYDYSAAALVGTECSRGYRQAIVSVTMQSGNMSTLTLNVKHNQAGLPTGYCVPWLDIALSAHNATSVTVGGANVTVGLCERIDIVAFGEITNATSMFQDCRSLASLTLPSGFGAAITNATNMFYACYALASLTLPSGFGAAITNATSMFQDCQSLLELIGLSMPVVTTTTTMFTLAYSLRIAPVSINRGFTLAACLSDNELNALYTALPNINGYGYILTVSGNYGYATSDTSIASAKGWNLA